MLTARDIMTKEVITVQDMTIEALGSFFIEKRISGAPVLDSREKLVGIVTENDPCQKEQQASHTHCCEDL